MIVLIIRKILKEEMKEALELVWKVFLEFEAPDYTEEGIKELKKTIDDNEWIKARDFYGAFDENNKVLGVIATKDITHIALFFVDGRFHNQGIGRNLFNKITSLNNKGFFTVNSSPYAHEVYKHLGFKDTDEEQCVNGLRFYPMKIELGTKNFKDYYKATINNQPSVLIKRFFINKYNEKISGDTALDLGCGTGNDTEFLISKGFKVTAVDDKEEVKEIFENKNIDKNKMNLIIGDFSKTDLPEADLILANMSLFFVKDNFNIFLKKLLGKVNKKGFMVANFLGKEDDWHGSKTTIDKEELLKYFIDFEMHYFSEEKYYKETALGKNKFWHVFTVIGQKK